MKIKLASLSLSILASSVFGQISGEYISKENKLKPVTLPGILVVNSWADSTPENFDKTTADLRLFYTGKFLNGLFKKKYRQDAGGSGTVSLDKYNEIRVVYPKDPEDIINKVFAKFKTDIQRYQVELDRIKNDKVDFDGYHQLLDSEVEVRVTNVFKYDNSKLNASEKSEARRNAEKEKIINNWEGDVALIKGQLPYIYVGQITQMTGTLHTATYGTKDSLYVNLTTALQLIDGSATQAPLGVSSTGGEMMVVRVSPNQNKESYPIKDMRNVVFGGTLDKQPERLAVRKDDVEGLCNSEVYCKNYQDEDKKDFCERAYQSGQEQCASGRYKWFSSYDGIPGALELEFANRDLALKASRVKRGTDEYDTLLAEVVTPAFVEGMKCQIEKVHIAIFNESTGSASAQPKPSGKRKTEEPIVASTKPMPPEVPVSPKVETSETQDLKLPQYISMDGGSEENIDAESVCGGYDGDENTVCRKGFDDGLKKLKYRVENKAVSTQEGANRELEKAINEVIRYENIKVGFHIVANSWFDYWAKDIAKSYEISPNGFYDATSKQFNTVYKQFRDIYLESFRDGWNRDKEKLLSN